MRVKRRFGRREVLTGTLGALSSAGVMSSLFPFPNDTIQAAVDEDPHFFLHINFFPGLDFNWFFDARDLLMTEQKLIHNPFMEPPVQVLRRSPTPESDYAWVSPRVQPLLQYAQYFSVLRGVMMAHNNVGHEANLRFLRTGSLQGMLDFAPQLNAHAEMKTPVDLMRFDDVDGVPTSNSEGSIETTLDASRKLKQTFGVLPPSNVADPVFEYLQNRNQERSQGPGKLAQGMRNLHSGMRQSGALAEMFQNVEIPDGGENILNHVKLAIAYFKAGITRAAVVNSRSTNYDCHAPSQCLVLGETMSKVVSELVDVIEFLASTPFDSQRSMMDVTTFLIGSEMGRTMRQFDDRPLDRQGTDHNPLANTLLVGGAKIRPGMIIGDSDFASSGEVLSMAHLTVDAQRLSVMARPFDHRALCSRPDKPQEFKRTDYLTSASVVNSILSTFNMPISSYHRDEAFSAPAPVLAGILI